MPVSCGARPGLFSTRSTPTRSSLPSGVAGSRIAAGTCAASPAACGGSARESQTRTSAPWRALQRAIARPDSPSPRTRVVLIAA